MSDTILSWFLVELRLYVTVNNQTSRPADVFVGVPQGSLLGPVHFIL